MLSYFSFTPINRSLVRTGCHSIQRIPSHPRVPCTWPHQVQQSHDPKKCNDIYTWKKHSNKYKHIVRHLNRQKPFNILNNYSSSCSFVSRHLYKVWIITLLGKNLHRCHYTIFTLYIFIENNLIRKFKISKIEVWIWTKVNSNSWL